MDQFVHKDRRQDSVSVPGEEVDLRKYRSNRSRLASGPGREIASCCTDAKSSANSDVNATASAVR